VLAVIEKIAGFQRVHWVNCLATVLNLLDDAILVDQKSHPLGNVDHWHQDSIFAANGPIGIAEDGIGKAQRLRKSLVFCGTIHTDSNHLRASALKFGDISLIRLEFLGSAPGKSLDVKSQNDVLLAFEIAQLDGFSMLVRQSKIRGVATHSE